jgi:2'-hydroxyisoflavone reductase
MNSSTQTRREFLQTTLAAGSLALFAGSSLRARAQEYKPMRILILGGTGFIGPALVEIALAHGHSVSVFNRGITEKRKGALPDNVDRLIGDRDPDKGEGLKALAGKQWDACIDDTGYFPRMVKASAELLAPNIKQYIFTSSISAYAKNDVEGADEMAELAALDDPTVETMGAQYENYGGLKVLCEQAAEKAMPGKTTIVRPGFIVGPGDGTDRFTYWPVRVSKGGEVLCPGTPDDPIQIIDVRDLAAFLLLLAERSIVGQYNACGPKDKLGWGEMLAACKTACPPSGGSPGRDATLTWVSTQFLVDHPDQIDLPLWVPYRGESKGFHTWSNARAVKAGLTFRPIEVTCRDTLEWWPKELERRVRVTNELQAEAKEKGETPPQMPDPMKIRAGLSPEMESKVLKDWHEKQKDT